MRYGIILLIFSLCLIACSHSQGDLANHTENNPTASEVLKSEPKADIFQYDDVIYVRQVDWVDEMELTKSSKVTEIKYVESDSSKFKNNTATKLPVGTEVFETNEDLGRILLVEKAGEMIAYLALIEG